MKNNTEYMNNIIEQMIKVAAEGGPITPRQKALILNKARELGEDIDLVEIALENTNVQKVSDNLSDKPTDKCPNCGAHITGMMLSCPECGFVYETENAELRKTNKALNDLDNKLYQLTDTVSSFERFLFRGSVTAQPKQIALVQSFPLPQGKESLICVLNYLYAKYKSTNVLDGYSALKKAWKVKAFQTYNKLAALGDDDPEIASVLSTYKSFSKI